MATVAIPTPTCKTLISELYGDRPTTAPINVAASSPPPHPEAAATVHFDTAWTSAVTRISALAQARLPEALHGRIQRATALALTGGVVIEEDGHTCQVRASNGTWYSANGSCPCPDHVRAPEHLCKHRLARGIYLRASELLREGLPPVNGEALSGETKTDNVMLGSSASPDVKSGSADSSTPSTAIVPAQYVVMIQGKPFIRYAGLLQMAHERGLVALTEAWTYNDASLSLAEAVATFNDGGQYRGAGDASPENCSKTVAPHFRRVALTRSKARALRDALNIDMCSVEELGEE